MLYEKFDQSNVSQQHPLTSHYALEFTSLIIAAFEKVLWNTLYEFPRYLLFNLWWKSWFRVIRNKRGWFWTKERNQSKIERELADCKWLKKHGQMGNEFESEIIGIRHKLEWPIPFYAMRLQGIMVVLFSQNKYPVQDDEYNYHDSLRILAGGCLRP